VSLMAMPLGAASSQAARRDRRASVEGRVDAILASPAAVHAGLGVTTPLGVYVRSGLVAALGASEDGISGRVDFINRFHLDPFRESRWAPYAGGGVSVRFDDNRRERPYLMVFAGIDGPPTGGVTVSFEAGFGGGGRIGAILRRSAARRR